MYAGLTTLLLGAVAVIKGFWSQKTHEWVYIRGAQYPEQVIFGGVLCLVVGLIIVINALRRGRRS